MSYILGYVVLSAVFLSLIYQGHTIHTETTEPSTSACHGISGPVTMNLTCNAGHEIAIVTIFVGSKPISSGCLADYDPSQNNDTTCCIPSPATDCIFAFDHTNYDLYHRQCNGQQTCAPQALNTATVGECNATYHATTTFAYIEYVCIQDSNINPICTHVSISSSESYTYISSNSFPVGMPTSATPCDCSVQASISSVSLEVAVLHRDLTGISNTSCDQSLTLLDSNEVVQSSTSCPNNTFVTQVTTVNDYVIIRLSNNQTSAMGSFLMEIRDPSQTSNLTINCPAVVVTTTTMTTTTMATTTTMTTTTAATTTTTPSPTNATTDTVATTAPTATQSEEDDIYIIIIIVLAVLVGILLIAVVIVCCCWYRSRHRRQPADEDPLTKEEPTIIQSSTSNPHSVPTHRTENVREERHVDVPLYEPVAFAAPVWAGYGPDSPEPKVPSSVEENVENNSKCTVDNSTNTDAIEVTTDEKALQAVVDTADQGCYTVIQTDAKGTNTAMPEPTAEIGVQTKPIRVKQKSVGIMAIVDETLMIKPEAEKEERDKTEEKAVARQTTVTEDTVVQNNTKEIEAANNNTLRNNERESVRKLLLDNEVTPKNTPPLETDITPETNVNGNSKTDDAKRRENVSATVPEQKAKPVVRQISVKPYRKTKDTTRSVVFNDNDAKGIPETEAIDKEEERPAKAKSVVDENRANIKSRKQNTNTKKEQIVKTSFHPVENQRVKPETQPDNKEKDRQESSTSSENGKEKNSTEKETSLRRERRPRKTSLRSRKDKVRNKQLEEDQMDRDERLMMKMMSSFFQVEREDIRIEKKLKAISKTKKKKEYRQEEHNGTDSGVETNSVNSNASVV